MPEMHINPSVNQALLLPCTKTARTGGIQNMTLVQSSVINVIDQDGHVVVFSATIADQGPSSLTLIHPFVAGEFSRPGKYVAWPTHTVLGGIQVDGAPVFLTLKYPWEKLNN